MRVAIVITCAVVLCAGCLPDEDNKPGNSLGMFEAVGANITHSCGTNAVPDETPLVLSFELRTEDNGLAYWQGDNTPLIAGTAIDNTFFFQSSQTAILIEPNQFQGYPGCAVTRRDVLEFDFETEELGDGGVEDENAALIAKEDETDVDGGTTPALTSFTGINRVEISPISGTDCSPVLIAGGGAFAALPCTVEYTLTGGAL